MKGNDVYKECVANQMYNSKVSFFFMLSLLKLRFRSTDKKINKNKILTCLYKVCYQP